jgi:aldose 1-epimerase
MNKIIFPMVLIVLVACKQADHQSETSIEAPEAMNIEIEEKSFGATADGDSVTLYRLTNTNGMSMEVMDYGGIITTLTAPDRDGNYKEIVLGFDNLQQYLDGHPFFGALVGRYGNRIGGAKFSLDGQEYALVQNNGENHLHGGTKGFDKKVWHSEVVETTEGPMLELSTTSEHMEEGYPGELQLKVSYLLSNDDALKIDYQATTDRPTIINMTQHSYFNLNPQAENILDHQLTINADQYLPVDEGLIPLGPAESVAGTPFDFRQPHTVGERISEDNEQLKIGGGYDHTWVFNGPVDQLKLAAVLYDPATGREMTVESTEPGVQFYSANFLNGSLKGKGKSYGKNAGLCLETHHYPDSPNRPEYPSVRLDPGNTYRTTTIYKFAAR